MYHIYTRGNAKQVIFPHDRDKRFFLSLLSDAVRDLAWVCHSYCVMDNHYHFLLETPSGNVAEGMHLLNGAYSNRFNRIYNRVGHVLQGRYNSPLVKEDDYFLELLRYIALNPVASGICEHPQEYRWNSYRSLAGLSQAPDLLTVDFALEMFDDDREHAREQYVGFVMDRLEEALEEARGKPRLPDILGAARTRSDRNRLIEVAHTRYAYKASDIARFLNVDRSTVSRIIRKPDKPGVP